LHSHDVTPSFFFPKSVGISCSPDPKHRNAFPRRRLMRCHTRYYKSCNVNGVRGERLHAPHWQLEMATRSRRGCQRIEMKRSAVCTRGDGNCFPRQILVHGPHEAFERPSKPVRNALWCRIRLFGTWSHVPSQWPPLTQSGSLGSTHCASTGTVRLA